VAGSWVAERPGYYYNSPAWVQQGDRWVLTRGSWERGYRDRNYAWRDRYHDGIPNPYDRDRDNDVPTPRPPSGQSASLLTAPRPARVKGRARGRDVSPLFGRRLPAEDGVSMRKRPSARSRRDACAHGQHARHSGASPPGGEESHRLVLHRQALGMLERRRRRRASPAAGFRLA
jgi:hypothetical protein